MILGFGKETIGLFGIDNRAFKGAVQKEMGSLHYFKFTRELKSAKI